MHFILLFVSSIVSAYRITPRCDFHIPVNKFSNHCQPIRRNCGGLAAAEKSPTRPPSPSLSSDMKPIIPYSLLLHSCYHTQVIISLTLNGKIFTIYDCNRVTNDICDDHR